MYYQGDAKGRYVPVAVPGHVPPKSVLTAKSVVYPTTRTGDGVEDHLATRLALTAIKKMAPRVLLINYPEFDWPLGHVDGGSLNRAKVITDMKVFDRDLGSIEALYRARGILNQTLFVITADHGMMPVKGWVPSSVISNAIAKAGARAPDISGSTGDYIWLSDKSKAQAVAQNIVNARNSGIQSVYYMKTGTHGKPYYVPASPAGLSSGMRTANHYLLSSLLNGHQPTVVAFAREGYSFSDPKSGWKADHGGNSWQSQHVPLILSGPGIRRGVSSTTPAQLEDVAPTALAAMGVEPSGMEGHVLADALTNPTSAAQQLRSVEVSHLTPVVSALRSLG
jgi:hypothetical protein